MLQRAAIALVCVGLLAGCGVGEDEPAATRNVKRADLKRLAVPKRDLGAIARGLKLDAESTGRYDNKKAAEDSIDPKDTARQLARAGRINGYEVTYTARRPQPLGVFVVSQAVELFRTEQAAARYLEKFVDDHERFQGRRIEGVKLVRVERFDADAGDDAAGLHMTLSYQGKRVFMTLVAFRRGRVFGGALALLTRRLIISGDVERIVDAIDDRVQDVTTPAARPASPVSN